MGGSGGAVLQSWNWICARGERGWHIATVADFNGDGVPDILWENNSTRQKTIWYMGGSGWATMQNWNWVSAGGEPGWSLMN
jgi:FG-GAP repeat